MMRRIANAIETADFAAMRTGAVIALVFWYCILFC